MQCNQNIFNEIIMQLSRFENYLLRREIKPVSFVVNSNLCYLNRCVVIILCIKINSFVSTELNLATFILSLLDINQFKMIFCYNQGHAFPIYSTSALDSSIG